jgi:hypothetical protein
VGSRAESGDSQIVARLLASAAPCEPTIARTSPTSASSSSTKTAYRSARRHVHVHVHRLDPAELVDVAAELLRRDGNRHLYRGSVDSGDLHEP